MSTASTDSATLPLRCVCGIVHGTLAARPEPGTRGRCYCDDCQAYARWLGGDKLMDAHGGTEVVQTWPTRVRLQAGTQEVRLLRLSEGGLHRWYAGCCRTPLANSFGAGRWPFLGLMVAFVSPESRGRLDELYGAANGVQGRFAAGGCPPGVHRSAPPGVILAAAGMLARGAWVGAHTPHPMFRPDGQALAAAEVLSQEARAALG